MQVSAAGEAARRVAPLSITAAAILISLAAAAAVDAAPTDPNRVAIVFPPWWSAEQAFTAAASEGELLGMGGVPFIVIVHRRPNTGARLARSIGALFIVGADPGSLCSATLLDAKS